MGNLGFQELLIIGVVVLVMFGGRKIPEWRKRKRR
jgi:sec-independent protein translocase protein TatA